MTNRKKTFANIEENFYQILDVPKTASLSDIRQAYEEKLEEAHLEAFAAYSLLPEEESEEKLLQFSHAYITLANPIARAKYDDELMVSELLFAAAANDITRIRQLIAKGIPVHAGNFDSRTALHLAAAEGNLETVKLLINYNHPLNVRDRWKSTPLDEAKREKRKSVINYLKNFK